MSQIWKGENWEVRHGRWQDSPPDVVDHVISDPPFTDHVSNKGRVGAGSAVCKDKVLSFGGVDAQDAVKVGARTRRWAVLFCAVEQIGLYQIADPDRFVRGCAWAKSNPTPQFTGDRPASWGEGIALLHPKGKKRWNGGGKSGLYRGPSGHAEKNAAVRLHETQKPLWLMRQLIEDFTDPGDLVWDPYGGSMTTGVACLQIGRRFLGHEMQLMYAEVGAERLEAASQGLTLKAARAGQLPLLGLV